MGALGLRFGAKGNLTNIDVFRLLEDICHCTSDCFGRHSELLSCLLQLLFELRPFHVFAKCGVSKAGRIVLTRRLPASSCLSPSEIASTAALVAEYKTYLSASKPLLSICLRGIA